MSEEKKPETPEVPNSYLAAIHANDNIDVVKQKAEAEKEEREANAIAPGVNDHLAAVHEGKVNEKGENIETVTIPETETTEPPKDQQREGGPSSDPAETTPETTAPAAAAPAETTPETTAPADAAPAETTSETTAPAAAAPAETTPGN